MDSRLTESTALLRHNEINDKARMERLIKLVEKNIRQLDPTLANPSLSTLTDSQHIMQELDTLGWIIGAHVSAEHALKTMRRKATESEPAFTTTACCILRFLSCCCPENDLEEENTLNIEKVEDNEIKDNFKVEPLEEPILPTEIIPSILEMSDDEDENQLRRVGKTR